jgi:aryl-alcohol dehydrogenase-like predicted oxidoreductase
VELCPAGLSNFFAWQLSEAIWTSKVNHLHTFITEQPRYNLLERGIESELVPLCRKYNIGIIPWGPLAGGFLTGKYRRDVTPPSYWHIPFTSHIYGNVLTDSNYELVARLEAFATSSGHSITELAIAWLLFKPWVCTVIAGVRNINQLDINIKAAEWKMTAEGISAIDAIVSRQT